MSLSEIHTLVLLPPLPTHPWPNFLLVGTSKFKPWPWNKKVMYAHDVLHISIVMSTIYSLFIFHFTRVIYDFTRESQLALFSYNLQFCDGGCDEAITMTIGNHVRRDKVDTEYLLCFTTFRIRIVA